MHHYSPATAPFADIQIGRHARASLRSSADCSNSQKVLRTTSNFSILLSVGQAASSLSQVRAGRLIRLDRQRCGRGRGNRDLLVRRTGSGTTSMFPPGAVQPPKRGKVAPFVSMWLLESFRNEPKVRPKTWFTVHDALPGSSTLCINFYAQSATSTNHTRFFRACGRNTYWRLPELIPKHGLAHAYLAITPDRRLLLPRIQGVCVHNSGYTSMNRHRIFALGLLS